MMDRAQIEGLVAADITAAAQTRDPHRWRRCHIADNPQAADIVARVWGRDPDLQWQILAVSRIAQCLEDGEPTPRTSEDPLAMDLEAQIDQAWEALNTKASSTS